MWFFLFVALFFPGCSREHPIKAGLLPLDPFDPRLSDTIAHTLQRTYGITVYILEPAEMAAAAFVHVKTPRHRTDILLWILRRHKPDSLDYIMGLTDKDISFTKRDAAGKVKEPESRYADWGIFGLGYRPGPVCVVSTCRLRQAGGRFTERVKKVALHEPGNNPGLGHCRPARCVMQDAAEKTAIPDNVDARLYDCCARRIKNR